MKNYIFINSHPIQYFAPLYNYLTRQDIKCKVWYLSDETISGSFDKEFGVKLKWDIPLLDGYEYEFVKNNSRKKGIHKGFFGLINWQIYKKLKKEEKAIVIVPGWQFCSYLLAIYFAKWCGHKVCLRIETPLSHRVARKNIAQNIKNWIIKYFLFSFIDQFLYIGEENYLYYKCFGIPENKLVFTPYAIDNDRFHEAYLVLNIERNAIRNKLNIGLTRKVILYSGKYIKKKRPLDVVKAFQLLDNSNYHLILMGEGELRKEIEIYVIKHKLKNVTLTGFINQQEIPNYYAIADLFVMCSGIGETWGLSVNEAMNFGLPVVISDLTGCAKNLVNDNGYIFKTGDVNELARKMDLILQNSELAKRFSENSIELIKNYSFKRIANGLRLI
jgi:glycosyltransferase involved in cell wall biosynthesis